MNVGRVTRLKSAPGRSCEMMWVRMEPCSSDTTVSSSLLLSLRSPSTDERLECSEFLRWPRTILKSRESTRSAVVVSYLCPLKGRGRQVGG